MSAGDWSKLGAFPTSGPFVYRELTDAELCASLGAPIGLVVPWYHRTGEAEAASIAWQGLIPSCWGGGDGCCVFGVDDPAGGSSFRGDWVVEIHSPALPGQLKAWWVPPAAVVGAWHDDLFYTAAALRERGRPLLVPVGSCTCELATLVGEQVALWRQTLPSS